jgi:hypothetical protein
MTLSVVSVVNGLQTCPKVFLLLAFKYHRRISIKYKCFKESLFKNEREKHQFLFSNMKELIQRANTMSYLTFILISHDCVKIWKLIVKNSRTEAHLPLVDWPNILKLMARFHIYIHLEKTNCWFEKQIFRIFLEGGTYISQTDWRPCLLTDGN